MNMELSYNKAEIGPLTIEDQTNCPQCGGYGQTIKLTNNNNWDTIGGCMDCWFSVLKFAFALNSQKDIKQQWLPTLSS